MIDSSTQWKLVTIPYRILGNSRDSWCQSPQTAPPLPEVDAEQEENALKVGRKKSLEHILDSGSDEKSIVFSQWASYLDLLETAMTRRGIGCVRFDGKLTDLYRDRALAEFSKTKDKMVLLMSLKAGGDSRSNCSI